jgi:hypothetical protein
MKMRSTPLIYWTLAAVLASPLAAVAAEKAAKLKVSCAPGVTVLLDGLEAGVCRDDGSGLLIGGVKAGSHVLRLTAEGFVDKVVRVQVEQGEAMAVVVGELDPAPEPTPAVEKPKRKPRPRRVARASGAATRSTGDGDKAVDSPVKSGAEGAEPEPPGDTAAAGAAAPEDAAVAGPMEKPARKPKVNRKAPSIGGTVTRGDPEAKPRSSIRFQARGASKAQARSITFFYLPEGGGKPEHIMKCQVGPYFQLPHTESVAPGAHR